MKDKSQRRIPRVQRPLDENYRDESGHPMKGTKAWFEWRKAVIKERMEANPEFFDRILNIGKKHDRN